MASYLYAVQDDQGREIVSAHVDVEKVSDITATVEHVGPDEAYAVIKFEDVEVDSGPVDATSVPALQLCRWPSDDKLATPVCHPVK